MKCLLMWFVCRFVLGKLPQVQIPDDWITMVDPCTKKMKEQVQEELTAAMTYFAMVSKQFTISNRYIIVCSQCLDIVLVKYIYV